MRHFKWIDWNLRKIDDHALTVDEVEGAFDCVLELTQRADDSYEMYAETPSGHRITVIWRYDEDDERFLEAFGELSDAPIFVITAF
jgi:hypothetical protein